MGSDLSKSNIERLTKKHIIRYARNLRAHYQNAAGSPRVNVAETAKYLNIWISIQRKDYAWEALEQHERDEILDAIDDDGAG